MRLALIPVVALLGCGGGNGPVVPAQADFRGSWTAPVGPAGCTFAVTFAAEEAYGAGVVCDATASSHAEVEWGTGTFTLAPSGRINFYPTAGGCRTWVSYAEYGGQEFRPTITLAPPYHGPVLVPSAATIPDDAVHGCFADDWTFTSSEP